MAKPIGPALLRKALHDRDMKLAELERAINIANGTVCRWLSAEKRPDLDSAVAVEKLLGVPVDSWAEERPKRKKKRKAPRAAPTTTVVAEPPAGGVA